MTKECPCRYCVPPKRYSGCHPRCKEYQDWNKEHQEELAKIKAIRKENDDCFPNKLRKKGGLR